MQQCDLISEDPIQNIIYEVLLPNTGPVMPPLSPL